LVGGPIRKLQSLRRGSPTRSDALEALRFVTLKPHDIESLVRLFEANNLDTLEVSAGGWHLFLARRAEARPSWASAALPDPFRPTDADPTEEQPITAAAVLAAPPVHTVPPGHIVVTAPSMGTFYRSEKPGAPPYVEVGTEVTPDTELCLIEVMKLFSSIRAGVRGRVARIFAENAATIAMGQPLFLIDTRG
jgi:biotin carboxyl carrier protein